MENEEDKNDEQDFQVVIREIKDEEFEDFQNILNKELIIELNLLFKIHEKKGLINYDKYMELMTEIFKKYNNSKDFQYLFDLIFNRFQKIKCILKNNKTVFYLTDMIHKKFIETYIIICFLTISIKCPIIDKIKLLFNLTDIDEDGLLNKAQIKLIITTVNFLFCENNENNINSSILSQSLMNILVKEKINKLMNAPGYLGFILQKEKYINFDVFFKCLEKIPNYKYEIIPCFINMKKCLYNQRKEKMIEVKNKNKKEFVRASSALSNTRPRGRFQLFKRCLTPKMEKIIKNVKIKKEEIDYFNSRNNKNSDLIKKQNLLLGIKQKNKSFKDLLKESTILAEDEDNGNSINKGDKKILSRNNSSYIFEADYDKIKKIEVEPALLKFSNENSNKKLKRYNSSINLINLNENKSNIKKLMHKSTNELNNNNKNIMNFRKIQSSKNNKIKERNINFVKRSSIFPMSHKKEIIKLNLIPNYTINKKYNLSLKNFDLPKSSLGEILENREIKIIKNKKTNKTNKNIFNKFNNIDIYKQSINKIFAKINQSKKNNKIIFRNNIKNFFKGSNINKNISINRNKKNLIKNLTSILYDKKPQSVKNISYNKILNKARNKNMNNNHNKFYLVNNRINKYLKNEEILKDLDDEEKSINERSYLFDKKISSLYITLVKEKSKLKDRLKKFRASDFSLSFYNINEIIIPTTFRKKQNSLYK